MAALSQTIANTLNVFGPAAPNVWGTFLWGENWGYGNIDLAVSFQKLLDQDTLTASDTTELSVGFSRIFVDTLVIVGELSEETLTDRNGYKVVFGTSSNAQNRPLSSYNEVTSSDVTYTTGINTQTTWTVIS